MNILFWETSKKGLHVILQTLGAIFAWNVREFAQIFTDFQGLCQDFRQIKIFGQWRAEGGANGAPAPGSQSQGGIQK